MVRSNLLKPKLARGELRCIGATTLDEFQQYIEKDAAFERRLQPVYVAVSNHLLASPVSIAVFVQMLMEWILVFHSCFAYMYLLTPG